MFLINILNIVVGIINISGFLYHLLIIFRKHKQTQYSKMHDEVTLREINDLFEDELEFIQQNIDELPL